MPDVWFYIKQNEEFNPKTKVDKNKKLKSNNKLEIQKSIITSFPIVK